jgi:hypothetical protein
MVSGVVVLVGLLVVVETRQRGELVYSRDAFGSRFSALGLRRRLWVPGRGSNLTLAAGVTSGGSRSRRVLAQLSAAG